MSTSVADLVATLRGDTSQFNAAMQSASGAASGFQEAVGSNSALSAMGSALSLVAAAATGAFVAGIASAISTTNQFDQMVQQSDISLQGLGKTAAQASAMTQGGIKLSEQLGVDPAQVQKSQQLLEGLVGSYADTASNITKLAGAAATAQQPLSNVTDQIATVANIMANNPSQGNWMAMQLAKQNIESYASVSKASATANSGGSEQQIFGDLINGLHGGDSAAKQYSQTLSGVKQSLKTMADADIAQAFTPLYEGEIQALQGLEKLASSTAMQTFVNDIAAELAKAGQPLDDLINKLIKLANTDLTTAKIDTFVQDIGKLVPLISTLAGMASGDLLMKVVGKVPVVGDLLGPIAGLLGGGGALGGALAGTAGGRQALADLAGAAAQLSASIAQALPAVSAFFAVIVGPVDDIVKLAAAVLDLAANFKPLDDAIAVFIAAYAGVKVWEGVVDIASTVKDAIGGIAEAVRSFTPEFLGGGVNTTVAQSQIAQAQEQVAAQTEVASAQSKGALAADELTAATSRLEGAQADLDATQQMLTDAQSAGFINLKNYEGYDEALVTASEAVTAAQRAQTAAQLELNDAQAAGTATGIEKLGGTAATDAVASSEVAAGAGDAAIGGEALAAGGEGAAVGGGLLGADGAMSLLGPIGIAGAAGLTGYSLYQMLAGGQKAQSSSSSFMSQFNQQHPADISAASSTNAPGTSQIDNLSQIKDRATAAKEAMTSLNEKIDESKKKLNADSYGSGVMGSIENSIASNSIGRFALGDSANPGADSSQLKAQQQDLKQIQAAYTETQAAAKNMTSNISAAMSATGDSQKQVVTEAQQLNIDLTMASGTSEGKANLAQLTQALGQTKSAMGDATTSATGLADQLKQIAAVEAGKTGETSFTISPSMISKMQTEANSLKKGGYSTTDLQNDINQLKPDEGQSFGTSQKLQTQLTNMQMAQQTVQSQQQLAQAQYAVGQAAFSEQQAQNALAQSYFQLQQAQQAVVQAQQQLVNAEHGVITADQQLTDAGHGVITALQQQVNANNSVVQAQQQVVNANDAVVQAALGITNAQNAVVQSLFSLQNAENAVVEASFSFGQAMLKMNEDTIAQIDANQAIGYSLDGITNKYATLNTSLDQLLPNQLAWGQAVVQGADELDQATANYTILNNQYTLANQNLQTLTDTMKQYQDIANQPLQGTKAYSEAAQANKQQQDALNSQINTLELEGANTKSQQVVNLQNQLDVLNKIGQQIQLNQDMSVGNEQFQVQNAQTPPEVSFDSAMQAASQVGSLQTAVVTATQAVDALKPGVDAANAAVTLLTQTWGPQIAALQGVESANMAVVTQTNAVTLADQQLNNAANGVTVANQQVANAANGVVVANQQYRNATQNVTASNQALTNATNNVTSAGWALINAQNAVTSAQWGVTSATEGVTNAQNGLNAANNGVLTANQQVVASINGVGVAQNNYKQAVLAVGNTEAQIAAQVVQDNLNKSAAVQNYVNDAETALSNLTTAEAQSTSSTNAVEGMLPGLENQVGSAVGQIGNAFSGVGANIQNQVNSAIGNIGNQVNNALSGIGHFASGGLLSSEGLFHGAEGNNKELVLPLTAPGQSMSLLATYAPELLGMMGAGGGGGGAAAVSAMSNMSSGSSAGSGGINIANGAIQVTVTGTGMADVAGEVEAAVEQALVNVIDAIEGN